MCTHWEYTLDRAYLKKVWPVLDKTANFFLKWCEKEELVGRGVPAEMKDGKVVRVEVKSEKGGRFRLVDPRTARGAVPTEVGRSPRDRRSPPPGWTRGKTRNSGEATLERDFKPGEVVSMTITGDCVATAAGAPAVSTCR